MGILFLGPLLAVWFTMGLSVLLDIDSPKDRPEAIGLLILALFFSPLVIASVFQVCSRQRPILKLYKEGLWIRTVGVPFNVEYKHSLVNSLILLINPLIFAFIFAFAGLLQLMTLRMFQIQTTRLRWENIDKAQPERLEGEAFTITGWCEKENDNDFVQDVPLEHKTISYTVLSFGESLSEVIEAVLFFHHNADARETLPSWQDEYTVFDDEFTDFR